MKRVKEQIKYLALLAICLLSGCSDFLDSYNPSAVTDDFYNTKEGQQKLLTDINAQPPVCRIIDYSKFLYQLKKRQKEQKAKIGRASCRERVSDVV